MQYLDTLYDQAHYTNFEEGRFKHHVSILVLKPLNVPTILRSYLLFRTNHFCGKYISRSKVSSPFGNIFSQRSVYCCRGFNFFSFPLVRVYCSFLQRSHTPPLIRDSRYMERLSSAASRLQKYKHIECHTPSQRTTLLQTVTDQKGAGNNSFNLLDNSLGSHILRDKKTWNL